VTDNDGTEYLDLVCVYGAIILGHCDEELNEAVCDPVAKTSLYPTDVSELKILAANAMVDRVPWADTVQFKTSGSEAIAHSTRLARSITGRRKVVKFEETYHG
jgi:glutamate-1-semialdehyde 2,1-aminomutase